MTTKFSSTEPVEIFAMANCAMILQEAENRKSSSRQAGEIFKCEICPRSFATFKALNGHSVVHKRPKLGNGETEAEKNVPKPYKCDLCGAEFWTGQALGGHMSGKHRGRKIHDLLGSNTESYNNNASTVTSSGGHSDDVKMATSNCVDKRMLGLDLNLSPEENESKVFES